MAIVCIVNLKVTFTLMIKHNECQAEKETYQGQKGF